MTAPAFKFAERLLGVAIDIVGAAKVELDETWARNPKVVGLALLCRSITNFRAAMILIRERHVVEARTLGRCLHENALWIAALRERGTEFVKAMIDDDAFNKQQIAEMTLKISRRHGANPDDETGQTLRRLARQSAERYPQAKKLAASKIAENSVIHLMYAMYQRLSLDALHCSVTALGRHLTREEVRPRQHGLTVTVEAINSDTELVDTVALLCNALVCVAITANEMIGFTSESERLTVLANELQQAGWHRMR